MLLRWDFIRRILRPHDLLSQHMAERIEQEEEEQEEDRIEKGEGCQTPGRVNDDAENLLRGLCRILEDIPGVQAHEATDIDTETTQGRDDEDKYPACGAPKTADDYVLHQVEGNHAEQ